jgi:large exoprotein involved in heme utilization and adhesion
MIDTGSLSIADAGQISSSAHLGSEGNGGNIEIKANEVSLSGYYDDGFLVHQSSILSETYGKGNAGNIMIDTGSLSIADAGQISSSAYSDSEGNGGNIEIKANEVSLSGYYDNGFLVHQSSILSETHGKGDAGNITMDTGSLSVDDAGQISTTSWGSGEGNGGDIEIKADDVSLSGYYDDGVLFYQSSIVSETYGGGNAGNIMIDTGSLSVADAGQISTTAWSGSEGNGGSITIKAGDRITISGHYDSGQGVYPAWIKSETFGAGSAGDISIETGSLFISDDGQISTSAREGSGGSGGDITIKADDAVSIVGYYDSGQAVYGSSIASETFGKGDAGNITVDTGSLLIADAGGISSSAREGSERRQHTHQRE